MSDNCDNIMNPATKGIQYDPSYDKKGKAMTTKTAREMGINLPEEYADWEFSAKHTLKPGRFVRAMFAVCDGIDLAGDDLQPCAYFFEPKPKPTLPDVKPGAVVRYVDNQGLTCRAVRLDPSRDDGWKVFTQYDTFLGAVGHSDEDMLSDVDADGFTVELDGL